MNEINREKNGPNFGRVQLKVHPSHCSVLPSLGIFLFVNTESTSQGGKKRGVREETLKKCQSGNGFKNTKKISFDAPFSCDSENHNRNLIELRERWEKIVL